MSAPARMRIAPLGDLPVTGDPLAHRLLRRHGVDTGRTVVSHLSDHAARQPRARALVDTGGRATSYAQLCRSVAATASALADRVGSGAMVAVRGPRSARSIVVVLALEHLGAVYLPVDPDWPARRLSEVLRRADAELLLDVGSDGSDVSPVGDVGTEASVAGVPVIAVPVPDGDDGDALPALRRRAEPDEARYAFFTSGSTGVPKGALNEHGGMINHLWAKVLDTDLAAGDVVAYTAPPTFDVALWQMLAALLVGATVSVVGDRAARFPRTLTRALHDRAVTVTELVPTVLGWLANEVTRRGTSAPGSLRLLMSTGEELRPALARRLFEALPGARLVNAYGFTETADDVTHHEVVAADLTDGRVPVGRVVINVALYVLVGDGDRLRPAAPGEPGELYVGGPAPARGYLCDDRATAAAFYRDTIDPASPTGRLYRTGDAVVRDGDTLRYLGRLDRQVKVGGVRVDLGEVESVLAADPGVDRCAVLAHGADDARHLVAFYVCAGTDGTDATRLRAVAEAALPAAMVPRRWVALDDLPVGATGKIDHNALARLGDDGADDGGATP